MSTVAIPSATNPESPALTIISNSEIRGERNDAKTKESRKGFRIGLVLSLASIGIPLARRETHVHEIQNKPRRGSSEAPPPQLLLSITVWRSRRIAQRSSDRRISRRALRTMRDSNDESYAAVMNPPPPPFSSSSEKA